MRSLPNVIKATEYVCIAEAAISALSSQSRTTSGGGCAVRGQPTDTAREQAERQAQEWLETTKVMCDQMRQEAQAKIEADAIRVREQSRQEGYEQGFEQGKRDGHQNGYQEGARQAAFEQQELLEQMKTLLRDFERQKQLILQRYEEDVRKLAFSIATKVIHTEIRTNSEAMEAIIRAATQDYQDEAWIRVTVSPDTIDLFSKHGSQILSAIRESSGNVKVLTSPEFTNGDCVINTPALIVDAGVNTQLKKVQAALKL